VNPKEIGEEWVKLAHSHGRALCWRFIEYWESIPSTDPYYGVYQEALRQVRKTPWGHEYELVRDKTRKVSG